LHTLCTLSAHPPYTLCAPSAAEPLDAATSILVVYFEPTAEAGGEAGQLTLYELIVEHRGEGAYKVSFLLWGLPCGNTATVRS